MKIGIRDLGTSYPTSTLNFVLKRSRFLHWTGWLATTLLTNYSALAQTPANGIYELVEDTPRIVSELQSGALNAKNCTSYIHNYLAQVWEKPSAYYHPKNSQQETYLKQNAEVLLADLFELRLSLKVQMDRFAELENDRKMLTMDCIHAIRRAMRYTRYIEEKLAMWAFEKHGYSDRKLEFTEVLVRLPFTTYRNYAIPGSGWKPPRGFKNTVMNRARPDRAGDPPSYEKLIETGDVLLMRGSTFISATIARIGDEDTQFSHLAIVVEDAAGKQFVMESLVEAGVIIHPLEEYVKHELTRFVVFRYKGDPQVAKNAGRKIYDYYMDKKSQDENALSYDFQMNSKNHDTIYCAELIQLAYELATDQQMILPTYPSRFTKLAATGFLSDLDVKASEIFNPADMEIEPHFDVVAEFRWIPNLRSVQIKDAVFNSIFDWMSDHGYRLQAEPSSWLGGKIARTLRDLGIGKNLMQDTMKAKVLTTILKLIFLHKSIERNLVAKDNEMLEAQNVHLVFREMLEENNRFRDSDLIRYQLFMQDSLKNRLDHRWAPPSFHLLFRP